MGMDFAFQLGSVYVFKVMSINGGIQLLFYKSDQITLDKIFQFLFVVVDNTVDAEFEVLVLKLEKLPEEIAEFFFRIVFHEGTGYASLYLFFDRINRIDWII
jgi:hypothetical protein